jgi:hypothetical protein
MEEGQKYVDSWTLDDKKKKSKEKILEWWTDMRNENWK